MAWRAIQDTVGVSLSLADLDDRTERIWWRILAHSDPWGRLDARPGKVRALCFPLLTDITDADTGWALLELERVGRVVVWEHDGRHIIQIVGFEERQPREAFRKRPPKSDFPDPPSNVKPTDGLVESLYGLIPDTFRNHSGTPEKNGQIAGLSGHLPEPFRKPSGGDGEETERRREETRQQHAGARDPAAAADLDRLRTAGWTPRQLAAAQQDLPRAIAWLTHCHNDTTVQSPAALAWTQFHSGATLPADQQPQTSRAPGALAGERSARPPRLAHACTYTYPDGTTCDSTFATPDRLAEHTADCHAELERAPLPPDIQALIEQTTPRTEPPAPPRTAEPPLGTTA